LLAGCGVSHAVLAEVLGRKDPRLTKSGGMKTITVSMPGSTSKQSLTRWAPRKRTEALEMQRQIADLANLERENRELKIALDRLRQSVSAIEFKKGVFIVGKEYPSS
jgi:hypothetical protein